MPAPHFTPEKNAERTARDARLAKALRDNLRRRKDQARAQQQRRPSRLEKNQGGDSEPPA
jgi:hypothetical protein